MIDLDDFKHINDSFGHRAADPLIVRADAALCGAKRAGKNRVCEAE